MREEQGRDSTQGRDRVDNQAGRKGRREGGRDGFERSGLNK